MRTLTLLSIAALAWPGARASAAELLPDIIVQTADLALHTYDVDHKPGRVLYRFQSSLPNVGLGELLLHFTGEENEAGLATLIQEIQQDEGPSRFHLVPDMAFDGSIGYVLTDDWIHYRIREVLPGDGVGEVLRRGQKEEIRLTSSRVYDSSLPNFKAPGTQLHAWPTNAGRIGISVGWTDLYPRYMEEQWVDITGLAPGEYWLEVEVDLMNVVEEADETNNMERIKITLEHPQLAAFATHRADTSDFGHLELAELLRVIQLFNADAYECSENTEDGFAPGGADTDCQPHSSDYLPPQWSLNMSELLRCVQLYNIGSYTPCDEGEDGFCPVLP